MAESKYDLLLVNTKTDKHIKQQPWYKERIKTNYIKSKKPTDVSKMLVAKNWTFIKDGLDDFRDGLPPSADNGIIIKPDKGPSPNIHGSSETLSQVKEPVMRKRFDKHEICYSRVTPLQLQRRDHIDEIEYGLTQHPLALYPHLEECMPPDVFEDVVDILDPEMNLASDGEESLEELESELSSIPSTPSKVSEKMSKETTEEETMKIRNPYKWLPRKEEKDKKEKKKVLEKRSNSPSQDEHIKTVTKDFCDWVASLGGDSNNIEESTITSLFASGYETKPALSVPIHVVELTNVPPELRMSAVVPHQQQQAKSIPTQEEKKQDWTHSGNYVPSWAKFKYGAWYLQPKSWKKRDVDEPLQDPKELKNQQVSEAKTKSLALDKELAPMHGAKSFMEFINRRNTRRPEFLDHVKDLQEKAAKEEQERLEAEQAKLKKLNIRRTADTKKD